MTLCERHRLSVALVLSWLCFIRLAGQATVALGDGRADGIIPRPIIVLVHGASGGGWQFKQVTILMEAKGWQVYRPTLSGLGERYHTATADIGLTTHIDDIVNLILFEDLHDVVLLGHSYAGLVVAGVADRIPERIKSLIYLDAFLPVDGESLITAPRPDSDDVSKLLKDGFIVRRSMKADAPPPRLVPQPYKTFTDTITLKNPAAATIPGAFILTVAKGRRPEDDTFYHSFVRARERGWPVRVMEATHFPMLVQPDATADLLMEIQESLQAEQIVVTTRSGRKQRVTRLYTIKKIAEGAAAAKAPDNPFDIRHPVYPKKDEVEELSRQLKEGDQIWYFQGLDSGWAVVRNGKVVRVFVTSHEY